MLRSENPVKKKEKRLIMGKKTVFLMAAVLWLSMAAGSWSEDSAVDNARENLNLAAGNAKETTESWFDRAFNKIAE